MKTARVLTAVATAGGISSLATMVCAQTAGQFVEAFHGTRHLVDRCFSNPRSTCNLVLGSTADANSRFAIEGQGPGDVALVHLWGASEGRMALFDVAGASKCVDAGQAAPPVQASGSVGGPVNLNVRAEARDDVEVVGVLAMRTCVATELRMAGIDGSWCGTKFGERSGWMRELSLRQNRGAPREYRLRGRLIHH